MFNGILSYLLVFNRKLTDAEVARVHEWLAQRFAIRFVATSIANLGADIDVDKATVAGGIITALTDDSGNGHTVSLTGSPTEQTIGARTYARLNGTDQGVWIPDHATLDGADGNTHVLLWANVSASNANKTYAQKGKQGVHFNGGFGGDNGGSATRSTMQAHTGADLNAGPAIADGAVAQAFESGAAVRRVDADGTYATNATAVTRGVGVGALTYGGNDNGVPTFSNLGGYDLGRALYYNRPLNELELRAAQRLLSP